MTYNLLAITPSSNNSLIEYTNNQLQETLNLFPDLEIEHVNESDPRFALYTDGIKFPCFIVFKDGARKSVLTAKLGNSDFINWVSNNLG